MNEKETEMAKAAQRAYMKQWRKNNPEKVRRHNMNSWLKKAQALEHQDKHTQTGGIQGMNILEQAGFEKVRCLSPLYAEWWTMEPTDGDVSTRDIRIRHNGTVICDLTPKQMKILIEYLDAKGENVGP